MRQKAGSAIHILILLVLGFSPWLFAQAAKPPSLKEQLEAQYAPGTVLVIQKAGILGATQGSSRTCAAIYQGSNLKQSGVSCTAALKESSRLLSVGEKVHPAEIQVNLAQEQISFWIVECDSCNTGTLSSSYKALIEFRFPKAYLEKASVPEVEDIIGQVLSPDESAPQQPAQSVSDVLMNSDVVKMVKAKLGDEIVISTIKSSACNFDTSVDGMVKLKQAGVSDPVIQAMRDTHDAAPETASEQGNEPEPANAPSLDVSGRWSVRLSEGGFGSPVVGLEQHPDGGVIGTWAHRGIVVGSIEGVLQGNILTYTMRQSRFDPGGRGWGDEADTSNVTACPGTFRGTITFYGDTASGILEGEDCHGTVQHALLNLKSCQQCKPPGNR
jgi:hypothetical protein